MRRAALPWVLLLAAVPYAACGRDDGADPASVAPYDADGRATRPLPAPARPPNLVVILVDTLRADAVGTPDAEGSGVMPFVTSLAREGVLFPDATAPAPWTLPSVASLFTGLMPSEHGCTVLDRPVLSRQFTTYAEVLRNAYGYETAGLVASPWLDAQGPLLQGFAHTSNRFALRGGARMVSEWDARRDRSRPFCLLLHTMEAHDPYGERNHPPAGGQMVPDPDVPPPDPARMEPWEVARAFLTDWQVRNRLGHLMRERLFDVLIHYLHEGYRANPRPELAAELRDAYFEGVRWVDREIRGLVDHLRSLGLLENTVLVVTGDHGEAFGEHGILEHGRDLHDELVRVPLVITGPAPFTGGRVVPGGVGLVDLFPTYFDLAGLVPLPGVEGRSLLPVLRGESAGRVVLSEADVTPSNTRLNLDQVLVSARSARWKYIVTYDRLAGTVRETVYDLRADPLEQRDLAAGDGGLAGIPLDAGFCREVERLRGQLRTAIDARLRQQAGGYAAGSPTVSWDPAPCGAAPAR